MIDLSNKIPSNTITFTISDFPNVGTFTARIRLKQETQIDILLYLEWPYCVELTNVNNENYAVVGAVIRLALENGTFSRSAKMIFQFVDDDGQRNATSTLIDIIDWD